MRSAAGLEMAAGLPGLSGPEGSAQDFAGFCGIDKSRRRRRVAFEGLTSYGLESCGFVSCGFASCGFNVRRSRAGAIGIAAAMQKQIEMVFEGTESSCYPLLGMGLEGIVASTSRRPN